jgi:peptide deformylase
VQIVKYPHPALRRKSKDLRRVDVELRKIVGQMFDLMYAAKGIGLSANQVDLPYRLFVLNPAGERAVASDEFVFINPVISRQTGMAEADEGCLSFPGIYVPVKRPEKIVISAYNLAGEEVRYELDGLPARAAQHEYDHLDGKLFIDRLSESSLRSIQDALDALVRQFEGERQRGIIPADPQIAARLDELENLRS